MQFIHYLSSSCRFIHNNLVSLMFTFLSQSVLVEEHSAGFSPLVLGTLNYALSIKQSCTLNVFRKSSALSALQIVNQIDISFWPDTNGSVPFVGWMLSDSYWSGCCYRLRPTGELIAFAWPTPSANYLRRRRSLGGRGCVASDKTRVDLIGGSGTITIEIIFDMCRHIF